MPQEEEAEATPQRPRDGDLLRARLQLTPEQVEQIRAVRRQTEQELRPLRARAQQARRALDEAIQSDAGETVIEQRARELAAAQGELTRLRALAELKVRRVLTPAQLEIWRGLRQPQRLRNLGGRGAPRERRRLSPGSGAQPQTPAEPLDPAASDAPGARGFPRHRRHRPRTRRRPLL